MKYYVSFEVDDSVIVDPRLAAITYTQVNQDGSRVTKEAVSDRIDIVQPITQDMLDVVTQDIKDEDIILFRFPLESGVAYGDEIEAIRQVLAAEFPGHKVLGLCNDVDLYSASPDDAIELLNKMIAHIKITNLV